jgi:hypothetical protein
VKTPEPAFNAPPAGPAKVKELAGAVGVTEVEGADAGPVP